MGSNAAFGSRLLAGIRRKTLIPLDWSAVQNEPSAVSSDRSDAAVPPGDYPAAGATELYMYSGDRSGLCADTERRWPGAKLNPRTVSIS